jgi:hypothetical protein
MGRRPQLACAVCARPIERGRTCSQGCRDKLHRHRQSYLKVSRGNAPRVGHGRGRKSNLPSTTEMNLFAETPGRPVSCATCGLPTRILGPMPTGEPCYHQDCAPGEDQRPWYRKVYGSG